MKAYIYLCVLINFVSANDKLLSNFLICKRSNPKLNECLKEAIQKVLPFLADGVKEFKIPSMQPLEIKAWNVKGTAIIPFEQNYKSIRLYNAAFSTINEVQSSITDNDFSIHIKGHVPVLKFAAQYQFDNAFFYEHNLTGNGSLIYVQTGNDLILNMTGKVNRNGNRPILEIISGFYEDTIEIIDINLEHSHIELSSKSSEHLSKHWKVLLDELTVEYSAIYAFGFKNIANAIFSQLDYDKVFPK